jgi:hypothetical protein
MSSPVRSAAVLCVLCASAFASDLKIVTTSKSSPSGMSSTHTEYFSGARSRTEWRDVSGGESIPGGPLTFTSGPRRALIWQCDELRLVDLNLDSREYTRRDLDKRGRSKAVKAPPSAQTGDRGTLEIYIDVVDTGERKQMFGHTARHIVTHERRVATPGSCNQSSQTEIDGWYADLKIPAHACTAPQRSTSAVSVLTSANCLGKLDVHRTGPSDLGYPLKLKRTMRTTYKLPDGMEKEFVHTSEIEVTELSDLPLDAALFEVPDGFKQVPALDDHSLIPRFVAVRQ